MEKPDMFYATAAEFLGKGLLTMNGPMYKAHRKIDGLIFGKSVIDTKLPMINEEVSKLIHLFGDLADGSSVDVRTYIDDEIAAASFRTLAPERMVFSDFRPIYHEARKVFEVIQLRSVNPLYYWLLHHLKNSTRKLVRCMKGYLAEARKVFDEEFVFITKRIKDTDIEDLSPIEIWGRAFIQLYGIENCAEPAYAEARTFLVASFDTSSFVTNTTLLLLALHPDVQQRVFEEVQSILGDEDRPVEAEDLSKMEYLDWVIKESLRLFPAGSVIPRRASQDTTVGGFVVPKGSVVFLNITSLHRNPDIFKDPLKFDPTRFSPERSANRHPFAFLPFSAGLRCCPGQYLAFTLIKTTLSAIVRNFKVLPGEGLTSINDIKLKVEFTSHLCKASVAFLKREA